MAATDVQAICSKEIMHICPGQEGCLFPTRWLEQCSVSLLGMDVEMQTPDFHAARGEGASEGI